MRVFADWAPGRHACHFFASDEAHRDVVAPFLKQGLDRNEKVMYVTEAREPSAIMAYLEAEQMDVESAMERGQMVIVPSTVAYTRHEAFDPDATMEFFRGQVDGALSEGFAALRATGEMTWALKNPAGADRLVEYESRVNELFSDGTCIALCQYDIRRFDARMLQDQLTAHPFAVIEAELYANPYFVPRGVGVLEAWLEGLKKNKVLEDEVKRVTSDVVRLQSRLELLTSSAAAGGADGGAPMKMPELLAMMLQLETRWQQQYNRLASQILNQNGALSETFREMATKEAFHVKRLEEVHRKLVGPPPKPSENPVIPIYLQPKTRYTLATIEKLVDTDRKALALALRMEQESIEIYQWLLGLDIDIEIRRAAQALSGLESSQLEHLKALAGVKA